MKLKRKLLIYPELWEDKIKELAKENISDVSKEINKAIRDYLIKNDKL
tara:strand:+ start:397 stop:540 length:144 start_codon:yes stop_codon:yes gene_type:complete